MASRSVAAGFADIQESGLARQAKLRRPVMVGELDGVVFVVKAKLWQADLRAQQNSL
jgi:hypothetical protein